MAFAAGLWLALAATLLFILLPIASVFTTAGPGALVDGFGRPEARSALGVSLRSAAIALVVILLVGTPTAYLLARPGVPGRAVLTTIIELPIVLPPAVAGIGLLAAFGPRGPVGGALEDAGIALPLTEIAVVIAMVFVAGPLYVRQAIAAFAAVDPRLGAVSETLGVSEFRFAARIAVPLAAPGLASGTSLALGRALGEFGATLLFAGAVRGVTETLPVAILGTFGTDFDAALAMGAFLIAVSGALLLSVKILEGRFAPAPVG
jgi:molybdate transport system permease protein